MGLFQSSPPGEEKPIEKWSDLLGETLTSKAGKPIDTDKKLEGCKRVALYFSAHWCPPCRGFTPVLAEFYDTVRGEVDDEELEIIFVSSDRDEGEYKSYLSEQPWLAVPLSNSQVKRSLASKYSVSGIPYLIVLDAKGMTRDASARNTVSRFKGDVKGTLAQW